MGSCGVERLFFIFFSFYMIQYFSSHVRIMYYRKVIENIATCSDLEHGKNDKHAMNIINLSQSTKSH